MSKDGVIEQGATDTRDLGAAGGGIGRKRFLAAAGGTVFGVTAALAGGAAPAMAAVGGRYFTPEEYLKEGETDYSEAIKKADEAAAAAGGYVLFGRRTYVFGKTLKFSAPWIGVPRQSILEAKEVFSYEGSFPQFSAMNAHFAGTFNETTADAVSLEGIDWLIRTSAGSVGKGSIGLANVRSGLIRDCRFSTSGSQAMGTLLDLYACVHDVEVDNVRITNLTEGEHGVGLSVRNLTGGPTTEANNTERIVVRNSYIGTSTGDEALAVYGVKGVTRAVRILDCTITSLPSKTFHARIASTFPLSEGGKILTSEVEDVEWRGCRFVDTVGTLTESGNLLAFGQSGDEGNICQNIRAIDCTFIVRTASAKKAIVVRNVPNAFKGVSSGNLVDNPRIDAAGSEAEVEVGIHEFPRVQNPTILGMVTYGLRKCDRVLGGIVEATTRAFYGCGEVSSVTVKLVKETATACYHDSATLVTASMRGCLIEGGQRLIQISAATSSGARIDIAENRMITVATSGEVVTNSTTSAILRLHGNTVSGPTALARSKEVVDSVINDWYGTLD